MSEKAPDPASPELRKDSQDEFLQAATEPERGLVAEFVAFMAENKMWWLTPILVVFGLLGVLLILGATGIAPFIYTLM
jgi:hypothetical protein